MQIYRMKKSNDGQQFDMTNFIHCFYAAFDWIEFMQFIIRTVHDSFFVSLDAI